MSDRLGGGPPDYWRELFESLIGQEVTIYTGVLNQKLTVVRPGVNFVECLSFWRGAPPNPFGSSDRKAQQTSFVSYNNIVAVYADAKWAEPG